MDIEPTVNSMLIQQEKCSLRRKMKKLSNHPGMRHESCDLKHILSRIEKLPVWSTAERVLLYAPFPYEPDLSVLLTMSSRRFFFPRMDRGVLKLYEWFPKALWITGPQSIRQPDPQQWREISLSLVDLAFIPGLAFDMQGNRLGSGYGYFDRLLGRPEWSALNIGIAWSWQLVPKIPREPHDVTMDFVVTPEKCLRC